jgi:hypothetical protein
MLVKEGEGVRDKVVDAWLDDKRWRDASEALRYLNLACKQREALHYVNKGKLKRVTGSDHDDAYNERVCHSNAVPTAVPQ